MFKRKHRDGFYKIHICLQARFWKIFVTADFSATDEEVRQAAKTSCADMFIKNMPEGYDTMLKGDGSNLSPRSASAF